MGVLEIGNSTRKGSGNGWGMWVVGGHEQAGVGEWTPASAWLVRRDVRAEADVQVAEGFSCLEEGFPEVALQGFEQLRSDCLLEDNSDSKMVDG